MLREVLVGTAAGAIGTITLNAATYADTAVRARPPSSVPVEIAGTVRCLQRLIVMSIRS